MNENELKSWFLEKLNSCYPVKHDNYPNNLYFFYDESFVRKIKLSKINNTEVKIPTKVSGKCIFELENNINYLYCDYDEIWSFLEKNSYSEKYNDIQLFILDILKETDKLDVYTPQPAYYQWKTPLKETDKLKMNIPKIRSKYNFNKLLKDADKLYVYTPSFRSYVSQPKLKNTDKLNVLKNE